ncbi:SAM-dependent methyltransferase [Streptomyces sp. NPDC058440]|uniref:SAM-dependent methyltransferase n=1 Tax=Streptomyces sp. NPDC058440 TaxID=3346501 RepID=UPI003649B2BA
MSIDVSRASDARIQNFLLGGVDNYPADRAAGRRLLDLAPDAQRLARINREFVRRAVRYLATECGVRQFLDHGPGLPARDGPPIHQVARRANKNARVVYIDQDPLVVAHARMMLDTSHTLVLDSDVLASDIILSKSRKAGFCDTKAPVAALFASVLHCVPDAADPWQRVHELVARLPSGSYLVLCHLTSDDPKFREEVSSVMRERTDNQWACVRSREQVRRFFMGLEPVGGPLGDVAQWHSSPDIQPHGNPRWFEYGGVARTP